VPEWERDTEENVSPITSGSAKSEIETLSHGPGRNFENPNSFLVHNPFLMPPKNFTEVTTHVREGWQLKFGNCWLQ
jgi:hypothetical protein